MPTWVADDSVGVEERARVQGVKGWGLEGTVEGVRLVQKSG